MRLCRGDAAALLTIVGLAACSPRADALAPIPEHPIPVPQAPAGQAVLQPVGDERFYVAAADTVRRLRVRARDTRGFPLTSVAVRFEDGDGAVTTPLGVAPTDSAGIAFVPSFVTSAATGRRTLTAAADGIEPATFAYLVLPPAFGGASQRRCPLPPTLLPRFTQLARVLDVLAAGDSLRIIAIGSSSTFGTGATSASTTYPARLQARLREAYPRSVARVFNTGVGGQLATEMLSRIDREIQAERPQLVIWQTGTIEAQRGVAVADFAETVRRGIVQIRSRGVDLLLLDSQSFPTQPANYEEYQEALATAAAEANVPVVQRYATMRAYVRSGRYTWTDLLWTDEFHPNDLTYDCMAHWILAGIMAAQVGGA